MVQTHTPPRASGSRPPFGSDGRPPQPPPPATSFSEVVFVSGARLRDGQKVKPILYSDIAERAAQEVAQDKTKNKPAQLRRFYDELVLLHGKVMREPVKAEARFEEQLPFIQMLKAKVAYATGRGYVDEIFQSLIRQVVNQTVDVETLRQARLFMEAFMAYYKVCRPNEA